MTALYNPRIFVLIPAAGNSHRMSVETPKQYLKINGKEILIHTINKLLKINNLKDIVTVINERHRNLYQNTTKHLNFSPPAIGGKSRKSSIYNGLKSLVNVKNDDIILIHDAARPFVKQNDIEKLLQIMKTSKAATLATRVTDTLYRENDDIIDRNGLWAIQTPQAFRYDVLIKAHEKFKDDDNFTDDAGLVRALGHEVEIVEGSRNNIKITIQDDYELAKIMMNNDKETRIAMGFDVHAFETTSSDRKLMLGGIHVPHDVALTGHSDADVVLHAITDALLGTINQGDIGTHFPPSDPQWKDVDSAVFLKHTKNLLDDNSVDIKFIDVTILAEAPKIGPHRDAMQRRIADILEMPQNRVSIKATTTEKLGFTGRGEGMACQAIATVTLPVTE